MTTMDPNAMAAASSANTESRAANKYRFELELEFVQSLANPHYLQALAQQGVMEDPSFVLYLDYLQYWSEPEYAKFIMCAALRYIVLSARATSGSTSRIQNHRTIATLTPYTIFNCFKTRNFARI
jgi:hypothetical protein